MRSRRAWFIWLGTATLVAVAIVVVLGRHGARPHSSAPAAPPASATPRRSPSVLGDEVARGAVPRITRDAGSADHSSHSFAVSGTAAGLFPGATVGLRLTLNNPNAAAIAVDRIVIGSARSDRPSCAGSMISIRFDGPLRVPARGSLTTARALFVRLSSTAGDACQGATFTMRLHGDARQVA